MAQLSGLNGYWRYWILMHYITFDLNIFEMCAGISQIKYKLIIENFLDIATDLKAYRIRYQIILE